MDVSTPASQVVIGSNSADHSARWLAAVQLKNVVNKHWRPRYSSGCAEAVLYRQLR